MLTGSSYAVWQDLMTHAAYSLVPDTAILLLFALKRLSIEVIFELIAVTNKYKMEILRNVYEMEIIRKLTNSNILKVFIRLTFAILFVNCMVFETQFKS